MASTWGGTAIPNPTVYNPTPVLIGSQYLVADGSMVTDSIVAKVLIDLEFAGVTNTERGVLEGKFTVYASTALAITNETSVNVTPIANSLRVSRFPGGTQAYTVSGQVRTT